MKLTSTVQKEIQLAPEVLEDKILKYLQRNYYKILENNIRSISFIDDENCDRKRYRSDFHTRIGEGKFEIQPNNNGTVVKLIYRTPILFPVLMMIGFIIVGFYAQSFLALIGVLIFLPVLLKIVHLNENVFENILE